MYLLLSSKSSEWYDIDDPREAYTYIVRECPNGLGAHGLKALETMWECICKKIDEEKDV